jgi:hypothetical protein
MRRAGVASVLIAVASVCLFIWIPDRVYYWKEFRDGNEIVARVEHFQKANVRLPETSNEVGVNDPDSLKIVLSQG